MITSECASHSGLRKYSSAGITADSPAAVGVGTTPPVEKSLLAALHPAT